MQEIKVKFLNQEDSPEKEMATHSFLPEESHEQRSLEGYVHGVAKESNMT